MIFPLVRIEELSSLRLQQRDCSQDFIRSWHSFGCFGGEYGAAIDNHIQCSGTAKADFRD